MIAAPDPLAALQALARGWRRELGAKVIGVTGSTGKTSTKDILTALLTHHRRTHANRQNLNTEIGLPLTILEAPAGTEVLVLEMAMRGQGQIAELVAIAEPDVGVIVNVGPVHLELLGTVERVAAAKAELIRDLEPGAACVVPASEPLLDAHLRGDLRTITFGPGGQVNLLAFDAGRAEIDVGDSTLQLDLPYAEPYNLLNTLAGVAAALAVGVRPSGRVEPAFSSMRGEIVELAGGVTVVNDCYNANPMSMRAALTHLAETPADRRVALLGTMAELGRELGRLPPRDRARGRRAGRGRADHGGRGGGALRRRVRRRELLHRHARGGRRAAGRDRAAGRPGADQGLAQRGARAGARVVGEILIGGMASLLICMFLGPRFIEWLRAQEFGQHIREEGPEGHHGKAGTPTMGGIVIFAAVAVPFLILTDYRAVSMAVFATAVATAGLGLADDLAKVRKKRSLGVSGRTKLAAQAVIAIGLWLVVTEYVGLPPTLRLRFVDSSVDLGLFYPVLILLVLMGATNGVNLTDGLDGLAAGCCAIVLLAFTAMCFITAGPAQTDLALLSACLVGACVGFLWFNSFPASVFMGDTGLAGPGRRHRGAGRGDQDRGAAAADRRHLRDRGVVGAGPGVRLPALPAAGVPDGPDPPPLRDDGLVGDEDHPALLDRGRHLLGDRVHPLPAVHCLTAPPLPPGPYLVVGLKRSGLAAARMLARPRRGDRRRLGRCGACRTGSRPTLGVDGVDLLDRVATVVKSPGVPRQAPVVAAALERGIEVTGELELAWRLLDGHPFVAVTGTNGKTTTVELLGAMWRAAGLPVEVAGNVGRPLADLVGAAEPGATVICEGSSFQLEDASAFAPDCAVLLNIEPDHLDRHGTLEDYTAAKMRIFAHDPPHRVMPEDLDADPFDLGDVRLRGDHNRQNARAAALAADAMGVPRAAIVAALEAFAGVPNRLEEVARVAGVLYVNDSKATNPASAVRGIESFAGGVHVLLGGSVKGGGFEALREPVARRCEAAYLIGEAAPALASDLRGTVELHDCGTLERAVERAAAAARPGDVVLLSPACASFDAFTDYEERGQRFRELVAQLG